MDAPLLKVGASVGSLVDHLQELFLVNLQALVAFKRNITHLTVSCVNPGLRGINLTLTRSSLPHRKITHGFTGLKLVKETKCTFERNKLILMLLVTR